jgi:aspartyl-tRNA(Asn)/glutamyl-tRNA(Gln) amidotransferase subunit B
VQPLFFYRHLIVALIPYFCALYHRIRLNLRDKYEPVIGLEIHTQLLTKSKAYSSDSSEYGAMPNSNVSEVTLGHPGTLPKHNIEALDMAIKMGLACGCDITEYNHYDRKNYFYADLPKGYQITQDKTPICTGGNVTIRLNGETKDIELTRIHMEEDSGKSIHDLDLHNSLIDYNRAGTPLIEIVTEPVMRTGDEAYQFVSEVRKLVRYLEICDGNMEEGSLRCDANISVRPKGQKEFGVKVEIKNMNSISNVKRAIEYEIDRQIEAVENGEVILQETRSFDAVKNHTFSMRAKELANDYRYFPEPDLPPLIVSDEYISKIKSTMPALPEELLKRFKEEYKLNEYDSSNLTETKELARFYLDITGHTNNYKAAANWLMGSIKGWCNRNALELDDFPIPASTIGSLINIIDEGVISNAIGEQKIFPALLANPSAKPKDLAEEMGVVQSSDDDFLGEIIEKAISTYPAKVAEYKSGKKGLLGLFMGEVMKLSKGKADPKVASKMLAIKLDEKTE